MFCTLLCQNQTRHYDGKCIRELVMGKKGVTIFESPNSRESHSLSSSLLPLSLTISHMQEGLGVLCHGRVRRRKSITSEVRGHQVLPLVQIRHPGLRSLLHDHLGEEAESGNENYRI